MKYYVQDGWELNPNKKVVESITKRIEMNNGLCPCVQPEDGLDKLCPCERYRLHDRCCCGLYVKKAEEAKG